VTAWYASLQTKLILSFLILIVVISGLTFGYTYNETKNALKESTQDELANIAGIMATQVDGDVVAALEPGDEGTQEYLALVEGLRVMRSSRPDLDTSYIMTVPLNGTVTFLVDDTWGDDVPGEVNDSVWIGDAYEDAELEAIGAAVESPSTSSEFYTDKWGTFLSGYAPIKNAENRTVAVLGVDMLATKVMQRQDFIGSTIYLIMAISALLAALIVGAFSRTIIRDIKKLNATATAVSMGNTDVMVDVERNDEIGELAGSFSRMVTSLKIMMMDRD